jgi:hypothetical protein
MQRRQKGMAVRICDLHTGRNRLTRATKQLRDQWSLTSEHWKDTNQESFEQNHLHPIKPQVTLLLAAVHRLSEVLEQAQRDCSEEDEE